MAHAISKETRKGIIRAKLIHFIMEDPRSVEEIAVAAGLRVRQVNKYYFQHSYPSHDSLFALSKALGKDIREFYHTDLELWYEKHK